MQEVLVLLVEIVRALTLFIDQTFFVPNEVFVAEVQSLHRAFAAFGHTAFNSRSRSGVLFIVRHLIPLQGSWVALLATMISSAPLDMVFSLANNAPCCLPCVLLEVKMAALQFTTT